MDLPDRKELGVGDQNRLFCDAIFLLGKDTNRYLDRSVPPCNKATADNRRSLKPRAFSSVALLL